MPEALSKRRPALRCYQPWRQPYLAQQQPCRPMQLSTLLLTRLPPLLEQPTEKSWKLRYMSVDPFSLAQASLYHCFVCVRSCCGSQHTNKTLCCHVSFYTSPLMQTYRQVTGAVHTQSSGKTHFRQLNAFMNQCVV